MNEQAELRPAVFIDRDGTIVVDKDYLADPAEMEIYDFSAEALQTLQASGYLIIIVTNQSGVGRGLLTEDDVRSVHAVLQHELPVKIDAFYYCPHKPDDGCRCRKPSLGMIEQAAAEFPIDIANSWMIGDKKLDIETGFNAGMSTALVLTGYGEAHVKEMERMPDIVVDNLLEAAKKIAARNT
jgi:histidinol-phosphate phosphatase family protein